MTRSKCLLSIILFILESSAVFAKQEQNQDDTDNRLDTWKDRNGVEEKHDQYMGTVRKWQKQSDGDDRPAEVVVSSESTESRSECAYDEQDIDIIDELRSVSTRFYIYDDETISQSKRLDELHSTGKPTGVFNERSMLVSMEGERNILHALEKHALRTKDPDEAEIFIVPTPIAELLVYGCQWEECTWFDEAFRTLANHPLFTKTRGQGGHIIISQSWPALNKKYSKFVPALSRNYHILENMSAALHYDQLAGATDVDADSDFRDLFDADALLKNSFSIGLDYSYPFSMLAASYEKFFSSDYFIFYRTKTTPVSYDSMKYRLAPLNEDLIESLPTSSIDFDVPRSEWISAITSSKFCLVIRGDTPHSHSFMHAVRAGCIPVIISNDFQEFGGPFKSLMSSRDFSVYIDESAFLKDPVGKLQSLQNLSEDLIRTKLEHLRKAQTVLLPDHPKSLFVPALLTSKATKTREHGLQLIDELHSVSTRFYIYEDETISQSKRLEELRSADATEGVFNERSVFVSMEGERNILHVLEKHPLRTRNPDRADLFIVPTPIAELLLYGCQWEHCTWFDEAFKSLTSHPIFRKTHGHKHVIISQSWPVFRTRFSNYVPALTRNYRILENVTVALDFDPFGILKLCKQITGDVNEYKCLYEEEKPVMNAFCIGLGHSLALPMHTASYEKFLSSEYFIFYHTRESPPSSYRSTKYRLAPVQENVIESLPISSIGYSVPKDEWVSGFTSSKFCLVIRGDEPHSNSFMHAVRAGCIPVIISNDFQEFGGPFKSLMSSSDFSIYIDESAFLEDPARELQSLQYLSEDLIRKKLGYLSKAQTVLLPDHPKSVFVPALLSQAIASSTNVLPQVLSRIPFKIHEGTTIISGRTLTYRYSSALTANRTKSDNDSDDLILIVGVISSSRNFDSRHSIRTTWASKQVNNVFFIVGGPWDDVEEEFYLHSDILWVDIEEDFHHNSYKVHAFLHAVGTNVDTYDYVMKTNEDVYLVIEDVKKNIPTSKPDYWGECFVDEASRRPERDQSNVWYVSTATWPDDLYPPFASGKGYALSFDFVKCAIHHVETMEFFSFEDVSTGILAQLCDVTCSRDGWEYEFAIGSLKFPYDMWRTHYVGKLTGEWEY